MFIAWPVLEGIFESLSLDMKATKARSSADIIDEYIYNMCIGNRSIDMPPTRKINDTTGNIAYNYIKSIKYEQKEIKNSLKSDILEISLVLDKMSIAFRRLTPLQQQILKLCYWEKKTWKEIIEIIKQNNHYISIRHAQELRRSGIEKMTKISRITIDAYTYIIGLLDEKIAK